MEDNTVSDSRALARAIVNEACLRALGQQKSADLLDTPTVDDISALLEQINESLSRVPRPKLRGRIGNLHFQLGKGFTSSIIAGLSVALTVAGSGHLSAGQIAATVVTYLGALRTC